ncbi:hypothetical protein VTN02DRAFT_1381 [Thermoascus thermophilus]
MAEGVARRGPPRKSRRCWAATSTTGLLTGKNIRIIITAGTRESYSVWFLLLGLLVDRSVQQVSLFLFYSINYMHHWVQYSTAPGGDSAMLFSVFVFPLMIGIFASSRWLVSI